MAEQQIAEQMMEEQQVVTFRLGDEEFGIDIMKVQEIIKIPPLTTVPRAPRYIEGVINLRGTVIPVINLKERFGRLKAALTETARIIIFKIHSLTMGILVDQVNEVVLIPGEAIEPPIPMAVKIHSDFVRGIAHIGNRLIIIVEIDNIIDKEQIATNA